MKFAKQLKYIALGSALFIGFHLAADIEEDRTNSIGSGDWQTGLVPPSDSDADSACNIIAGLPFSCTLPTSGGGSVTCSPVTIPGGMTLSSGCVLAGSSPTDFSVDVQFDDGVSDPVTKTINLTAGPNQSPSVADPTGCSAPQTGVAWSCDLASSVSDPEGQALTYSLGSSAPSWASISGSVLSGTPTASGSIGVPYEVSDSVNIVSYTYNITVTLNAAAVIEGDDPVTPTLLADAGVSQTMQDALSVNGCGSSGTQNCLDVFNENKGSTSCTLAGGSSASGAQIEAFAQCVIVEDATATAASVPTTLASTSASSGCSTSTQASLPSMCGYSAWRCYVTGMPSDWNLLENTGGVNSGGGPAAYAVEIPSTTTTSGTVTLSVAMKLAPNYSDHLIKTVSLPVNVTQAVSDAVNGVKQFTLTGSSSTTHNWAAAFNSCQSKGGKLGYAASVTGGGNKWFQPAELPLGVKMVKGGQPSGSSGNGYSCWGKNLNYPVYGSGSDKNLSCQKGSSWYRKNHGSGTVSSAGNWSYACVELPSCPSN
jgi:hypothetical protein